MVVKFRGHKIVAFLNNFFNFAKLIKKNHNEKSFNIIVINVCYDYESFL